jgi:hypothetical protein
MEDGMINTIRGRFGGRFLDPGELADVSGWGFFYPTLADWKAQTNLLRLTGVVAGQDEATIQNLVLVVAREDQAHCLLVNDRLVWCGSAWVRSL